MEIAYTELSLMTNLLKSFLAKKYILEKELEI